MAAREIPIEQLSLNARGLALAAFGSIETLTGLLGGDADGAHALKEAAQLDWMRLRLAVDAVKRTPN